MIHVPELSTMNQRGLRRLRENTAITNGLAGGPAANFIRAFNETAYQMFQALRSGELASFISRAEGSDLEKYGEVLGLSREDSRNAQDLSSGNFRFYIDPTLGNSYFNQMIAETNTHFAPADQLPVPGAELVFPSGLQIYSSRDEQISYVTMKEAIMTADNTEVYVPVIANQPGTRFNAAAGTLNSFNRNASPYLRYTQGIVLCGNKQDITSGKDIMSDQEYRFQLVNRVNASANANEVAIRIATLSIPGVVDVIIAKYSHGLGTFTVFPIVPATIVGHGILESVQARCDEVASAGNRSYAMAPIYIGVALRLDVNFHPDTSNTDRKQVTTTIRNDIVNYINNIDLGGEMILSTFTTIARNASEQVRDAQIVSIGAGELDTDTFQIMNFETLIQMNQLLRYNEKFYTNASLVEVCYI